MSACVRALSGFVCETERKKMALMSICYLSAWVDKQAGNL